MSDRTPPSEGPAESPTLFPMAPRSQAVPARTPVHPRQGARLKVAERGQITWARVDLDGILPEDHSARAIWAVVGRLDLNRLYAQIAARDEVAGASAIDPKILLSLWIYATSEGEGSGREIERLTQAHDAYRWICGGVKVCAHTLTDFRSQQGEVIDQLITQVLALLMKQELVDLHRVAQDGTRVRASAGASSFRRAQTLQGLMEQAREHLRAVTAETAHPEMSARRAAARKRGAADRLARLEAALQQVPEITRTKEQSGAKDSTVRVSTTDPDARVMKRGDGGFRPAYNVQFATTTDSARVIVGVEVTNRGSDQGESTPMLAQIEARTAVRPDEYLVDGGYTGHAAIEAAAVQNVTMYGPVPKPRKGDTRDPHARRADDSAAVGEWRERMGTSEAKAIYKERAATAETVNADGKAHRGLDTLMVRGLTKVTGSACLFALTYNILRAISLGLAT